jgi:predicted metalloprotease with PDZ domain
MTGAALALLVLSGQAMAGGEKKCTHTTQECLDYMATQMKDSGWVGVELDGSGETYGPMTVTKVVEGGPAEAAGIQVGDKIVAIAGIQLAEGNQEKLSEARKQRKPGDEVTWSIERADQALEVAIQLGSMPADILARYIGQHMLDHATTEVAAK